MTPELIGVACIGFLLILLLLRVPIALALLGVSLIGITWITNFKVTWSLIRTIPYTNVATWTLSAVPLFLFMGYLCYQAGITTSLFRAARLLLARLPGGLVVAAIFGSAGFAAVTGSSVACAAAMGKIAIPEMMKQRYDPGLATGTVAAAGTLGALIPPSILLIIYATMAQVSIIQIFLLSAVLGLMTTIAYILVVVIRVRLRPELAPQITEVDGGNKLLILLETWPVVVLAVGVFGGLFGGYFTATEAGAVGSILAIAVAAAKGSLNSKVVGNSLREAAMTTSTILFITVGAAFFTKLMTFAGISEAVLWAVEILGSSPILVMLMIALVYLILGMFLEPIGAMLITLPIFLPIARDLGYDTIWFGVMVAKLLEVGMITPPVGLNVFVIKNVVGKDIDLHTIFGGVFYFVVADILLIILNIIFPDLMHSIVGIWKS